MAIGAKERRGFLATLASVLALFGFIINFEQGLHPTATRAVEILLISFATIGVLILLGVLEVRSIKKPFWVVGKGVLNDEEDEDDMENSSKAPIREEDCWRMN